MEHASNGVGGNGGVNTPHRQMPSMPSKTPVSLLQELCAKRGITPKYDLIQVDGAVHEPTFLYRATVGEFIATEKGQSKKKAKHAVAKAVLDMVLGNQAGVSAPGATTTVESDSPLVQLLSPYDDGIPGNPVGQLQELCMKYKYPPPVYEVVQQEGLAHERTFTMEGRIGSILCETGVGKSKKVAKRQTANQLLKILKDNPPPPSIEGEKCGDDDQVVSKLAQHFASLRTSHIGTLTPPNSAVVGQFHRELKNSTGANLEQLQKTAPSPVTWNCVQFLESLAQEQNFEITWVDVVEKSLEDRFQCVVQLSSFPVAVCYGVGEDQATARTDAAHNALQYLKIMINK